MVERRQQQGGACPSCVSKPRDGTPRPLLWIGCSHGVRMCESDDQNVSAGPGDHFRGPPAIFPGCSPPPLILRTATKTHKFAAAQGRRAAALGTGVLPCLMHESAFCGGDAAKVEPRTHSRWAQSKQRRWGKYKMHACTTLVGEATPCMHDLRHYFTQRLLSSSRRPGGIDRGDPQWAQKSSRPSYAASPSCRGRAPAATRRPP